jgi:hypothetical protein
MVATGISAVTAGAVGGNVSTGLTATGSTQATALALPASINAISTAAASTGVILPSNATSGDEIEVYNGGANAVTVYPPVGGTINNLSANTGLSLATLKSGKYKALTALAWYSLLSG